jgi:hypothetical protein
VVVVIISPSGVASMTIFIVVMLVFSGVVLPAVWSARPERRCAATQVLRLLLRAVIDLRPRLGGS